MTTWSSPAKNTATWTSGDTKNTTTWSSPEFTPKSWMFKVDDTYRFLLDGESESSGTIIDSHPVSNASGNWYNYPETSFGQSFTNTNYAELDSVVFYLTRTNSPTGNAYAKIYAHTGTFGTNGTPTGSPLATSDAVDVTSISTSFYVPVTFTFSGSNRIILNANTKYFVVYSRTETGSVNVLEMRTDAVTPTHSGNSAYSTDDTNWTSYATDIIFYVYSKYTGSNYKLLITNTEPSAWDFVSKS